MDFNLFFLLLAVAGNETDPQHHGPRHAARSSSTRTEYAKLVEDRSLVPTAVEEMLRWASPVMYFRRNVTRDTEIRGHPDPAPATR